MPQLRLIIASLLSVLTMACVEPPPYPKFIPRADVEVDTDTSLDTRSRPDQGTELGFPCVTASDCPAAGPCQGPATCQGPGKGCAYESLSGSQCDDTDPCTTPDICESGVCITGPRDCSAFDGVCLVGTCSPVDGACAPIPAVDGAQCDDGKPCTVGDACDAAKCVGNAKPCEDLNPCTLDSCESSTGTCVHAPVLDGMPCDDGDGCTTADTCNGGDCVAVSGKFAETSWQVSLAPFSALKNSRALGPVTGGGVVLAFDAQTPVTVADTMSGRVISPTRKLPDDSFARATWIVTLDPAGSISHTTGLGGSADVKLRLASFSEDGGAFLLVERWGSLWGVNTDSVDLPAPTSGSELALVYVSPGGGIVWAIAVPASLTPLAITCGAADHSRLSILAQHATTVTPPSLVATGTPPLPSAATGHTSISYLAWSLDGRVVVATAVGSLGDSAELTGVRLASASDHSFAAAFTVSEPSALVIPDGPSILPGGPSGVLFAYFTADGSVTAAMTALGMKFVDAGSLNYQPAAGLLTSVSFSEWMEVAGTGQAVATVVAKEAAPGDPPICSLRFNPAGELVWPLPCVVSGGITASHLGADGRAWGLATRRQIIAPSGTLFHLSAPSDPAPQTVVRLTSAGQVESLTLFDSDSPCGQLFVDAAGTLTCSRAWFVFDDGGAPQTPVWLISRPKAAEPVGCGP